MKLFSIGNNWLLLFMILTVLSCSSGPEKKTDATLTPVVTAPLAVTVDRIERHDGMIGLHGVLNRLYQYDGATLTVFEGHEILCSIKAGNAGHFKWNASGTAVYYIEYHDFIKTGSWLNAGVVKKLTVTDGTVTQISVYENVTYFNVAADELSAAVINLGSVILLTFEKDGVEERKLSNGFGMSVYFAGEWCVVYERRDNDILIFLDKKGKERARFNLHPAGNRWTPPDRIEIGATALTVYSDTSITEFSPIEKPKDIVPVKKETVTSVDIPESLTIGNAVIRRISEDGQMRFYCETGNVKELLYTMDSVTVQSFFTRGNYIYCSWPKGLLVFSYTAQ